ncbi:MAG: hypothetical protein V4463_19180 [Pseudomonadota bacterium]
MFTDANFTLPVWDAARRRRMPVWVAAVVPWVLLWCWQGLVLSVLWVAFDAWRLRVRVRREALRWLDAEIPALEDSTALLVQADSPVAQLQRARLQRKLAAAMDAATLRTIAHKRVRPGYRWLSLSLAAAVALGSWQYAHGGDPIIAAVRAKLAEETSDIVVRVLPPAYTGAPRVDGAPHDMQVPEHSRVEWCLKTRRAQDAPIELSDGQLLKIGHQCAEWTANESVFWRWHGVRYNLRVLPDRAPDIEIAAPKEIIHVLPLDARSAAIAITVRDDYAVKRAVMHMTLARGNGENIRFSDREVVLPESNDPKLRTSVRQWSLAELGMKPGDELYFFVRATDNAEPPHASQSPTYTLRLPGPQQVDTETTALPVLVKPENLRSQRQVIIDTEQLVADMKANPRLDPANVRNRSETIARDQALLRRRYGQFLGEESSIFGEEEHESHGGASEHGLMAQFGHMHDQEENATLFDEATKKVLRRALAAMWDAEKELRAITPKPALPPEYKALEAIKELQQADRIYLHKTAFAPPAIKEDKRMTGDVVGTKNYQREQGAANDPVPAEVRALLRALAADGALPALWSRDAHDWIRARISNDEQRLAAQRAVQDVADGCVPCRAVLRAWLRGAITEAPVLLQARPVAQTPFVKAWGAKP